MRQLILGTVGVVWGGALVIAHLTGLYQAHGSGAYRAGQNTAWLIGLVFFVVGAFAVRNGLRARRERGHV